MNRRLLEKPKLLTNGKYPGMNSSRLFWSELLKTAHRTSAKCSVGTLSEPATYLVGVESLKNCHFSAIFSCLTKTDELCVHLPTFEKYGFSFGVRKAIILSRNTIPKGC